MKEKKAKHMENDKELTAYGLRVLGRIGIAVFFGYLNIWIWSTDAQTAPKVYKCINAVNQLSCSCSLFLVSKAHALYMRKYD